MIAYVASVAALVEEPDVQKVHAPATEEILKAFSTFLPTVPETSRKYHVSYITIIFEPWFRTASTWHLPTNSGAAS